MPAHQTLAIGRNRLNGNGESMALSAFANKTQEPQREELVEVLAVSADQWDQLISSIGSRFGPLSEDWIHSGKQWGWALRLKHKKRAVLYMTPSDGFFYVGFALGQKAVDAAHASHLPSSVLEVIDTSQKFAEGRAVRLEVRSDDDVRSVVQLADIKMST
jgi:hypothetical protein